MRRAAILHRPLAICIAGLLCVLTSGTAAAADSAAYHYALAKLHAADGEYQEAEIEFVKAIELDEQSAVLRVDYAQLLGSLRRYREARQQAERALQNDPESVDALRTLGQIQWSQGRSDPEQLGDARKTLERLNELAPEDLQGGVALAQIYEQTEALDEAIEVYRRLVSSNTDNAQLKRMLIDALSRAGRSEEARIELQEMLRIEQESSQSRMALAELESEKGNYSEAIRLVEEGDDRLKRLTPVRGFLAEQYLRRASAPGLSTEQRNDDLDAALRTVRSIAAEEKGPGLFRLEGTALRRLGRSEEALALYRDLVRDQGSEVWSHLLLSGLLEAMQRPGDASAVLEAALDRFSGQAERELEVTGRLLWVDAQREAWARVILWADRLLSALDGEQRLPVVELKVEALSELGREGEALRLLRSEKRRQGQSSSAPLALMEARALSESGRTKDALEVLRKRPLLDSTEGSVLLQSARLLRQLGDEEGAFSRIERFASDGTLQTQFTAGQFFSSVSRFEEAIPYLRGALQLAVDQGLDDARADVHFWLGQALERTGNVNEAAEEFREVLKLRPDDTTTMNYLGYMWAEAGIELEAALKLVERAVQIEPDNGSYVDSLGWALFRLGRLEEAREQLQRATELSPGNAVILEHLGDVLAAIGDLEAALGSYTLAVDLEDPENQDQVSRKIDATRAKLQQ